MHIIERMRAGVAIESALHRLETEEPIIQQLEDMIAQIPSERYGSIPMPPGAGWALPFPRNLMLTENGFRAGYSDGFTKGYNENYKNIAPRYCNEPNSAILIESVRVRAREYASRGTPLPVVYSGIPADEESIGVLAGLQKMGKKVLGL